MTCDMSFSLICFNFFIYCIPVCFFSVYHGNHNDMSPILVIILSKPLIFRNDMTKMFVEWVNVTTCKHTCRYWTRTCCLVTSVTDMLSTSVLVFPVNPASANLCKLSISNSCNSPVDLFSPENKQTKTNVKRDKKGSQKKEEIKKRRNG